MNRPTEATIAGRQWQDTVKHWWTPRKERAALDAVCMCGLSPCAALALVIMSPTVLESSISGTASAQAVCTPRPARSTDALLSIDQVALLLGRTLKGARNLTSMGLLKYQLINGERYVRLGDLIAYKRDFDKGFAEWKADPLNQVPDDLPNPFEVIPEYAQMLEP